MVIYHDHFKKNYGVLGDSAFLVSGNCFGRIITPLKQGDIEKSHPSTRRNLNLLSQSITSCRQACEWGMGSVDKVFRRLQMPLPYNMKQRGLRLRNLFHLYNYRVRRTHISQIRNYFSEARNEFQLEFVDE